MADKIKKVSFLIFSISNTGGSERMTCNLANELSKRNYEVSIINIYNDNSSFFPLQKGVSVIGVYTKPTKPSKYHFPFVPFRILKLLTNKSTRPDILIGINTDMIIYALPAIRLLHIPFISTEHFNITVNSHALLSGWGRKLSARYADVIVVLTTKDKILYEKQLPVKCPVICIQNFTLFQPETPATLDSNIAISAGRYTHQKGFDNLINIWEKVTPHHPEWKLKIIGKGEDEAMLKEMIREKKLENFVTLVPQSNSMPEYYKEASLFLLSSRWEGLPMVLIEAKTFGLPVVSFDCETGPRDMIENNVDGILIRDGDNDAFASALIQLLGKRERLQQMGKKALTNSKQYTPDLVIPRWEDLFNSLTQ